MKIIYTSIDRVRDVRNYKTLAAAQKFAHRMVGPHPDIAGNRYAVSCDGIGKIQAEGVTLRELFPEPNDGPTDGDKATDPKAKATAPVVEKPKRNGNVAALKACRTMVEKKLKGVSATVRKALKAKIADYDRRIAEAA